MNLVDPISKDLVLIGGGHSHLEVLKRFGMRPLRGVRLTLITRDLHMPYSGMLPGLLAGHYTHGEAHIDLRPLSRFAGARLYHCSVTGIDFERQQVLTANRPPVPFDLLSINIGSTPALADIAGAAEHALAVRPVEHFLGRWEQIESEALERRGARIVVVGAGAGGVELTLALEHRLNRRFAARGIGTEGLDFRLVSRELEVLPDHGRGVRQHLLRVLMRRGIAVTSGQPAVAFGPDRVVLEGGEAIPCHAAIAVTHAAPAAWLRDTPLSLDGRGFIHVDTCFQSISHPVVFAVGDVTAFMGRRLPKSGVYAVRSGPALEENLRRRLQGLPLRPFRPQRRTLALISTGNACAVASYAGLAVKGDWVWRLKDWIDRRWMRKYQVLPRMAPEPTAGNGEASTLTMRCGGCGAKVASHVLRRVLRRLDITTSPDVLVGIGDAEDAAVIVVPAGGVLVQSVDHFRGFIDDPYLFGRITTQHCLGDLHAMGAEPRTAQALVTLPYAQAPKLEQELEQLLAGTLDTLREANVTLVGGHTAEGPELAFGLAVNGIAQPDRLMRKAGAGAGEVLILTKPLGTGVLFAADMRARSPGPAIEAALAGMIQSNGPAARCLLEHGATACTDVTGFGLLGHLVEVLEASGQNAEIELARLPVLPAALDLLGNGFASTLQPANEAFDDVLLVNETTGGAHKRILFDPQTSGGLLASLPPERADDCVAALRNLGYAAATAIGRVRSRCGTVGPRVGLV